MTRLVGIRVSHPFARKKAKGWGTELYGWACGLSWPYSLESSWFADLALQDFTVSLLARKEHDRRPVFPFA
jgi:hypothetical protein